MKDKESAGPDGPSPHADLKDFAHEVLNPLSSVLSYTSLMQGTDEIEVSEEKLVEYAAIVHEATKRVLKVCERVLDDAAEGDTKILRETVDFAVFGEEIVNSFRALADEHGINLSLHVSEDFPLLSTDPVVLGQILSNLIGNAMKFTPRGGNIEARAQLDVQRNAVIFVVADDGDGIPAWMVMRLLRGDFQSAATDNRGWGRGLKIVKSLAEHLNADFDVVSEPGKGSVFSVTLSDSEVIAA